MGTDSTGGASQTTIQAVERASNIVGYLEEEGAAGTSEIAADLDIPKSTAHVHLRTLREIGFVTRTDGEYRLSLRFLEIGGRTRQRMQLYRTAKQEIDKLSGATGEVANLGVEEDGMRVLLYRSEVPEGVFDNAPTGEYTHMHWTALGKALLAHKPADEVDEIVETHGLPEATDRTIADRGALTEELAEIRDRGYAVEDQDRRIGVMAVAVPILDSADGDVVGAVSLSGPKNRFEERRAELLDEVRNAVNVIQLRYEHY